MKALNQLAYKKNAAQVVERLRALYERRAPDRILARFEVPSRALVEFRKRHPEGFCDYPDPAERIRFWDGLLKERLALEDDSMPWAYFSELDQGLYAGLFGGEVQFLCHEDGFISSMVFPLLKDLSELKTLSFSESGVWFQRYLRQMKVFVDGAGDRFGICHFILIDGLNFAFELVGATETYICLMERPELVQPVIDFAFDLNVRIHQTFFEHVPLFQGGTFSNMAQWLPGRIISESVDPFHMTGVDCFERWGRGNVEKIFSRFDGGILHIHGNGRHLFEAVCSLKGLKAIRLGDDKGFPLAFDVLKDIRRRTGDTPLVVVTDFEPFQHKLNRHELTGGVLYEVKSAPNAEAANRCMEKVRAYRA